MKHTPGPWINKTDGEANFSSITTSKNWLMRIQQNGELSINEQEANAKLIAALPELLEALRYAKRRIIFLEGYTEGKCDPTNMNLIDNAINKAIF